MRILHVGKFYYPFRGGMESVVRDICQGLESRGEQVEVVCSNTEFNTSVETIHGIKVHRLGSLGNFYGQCLNISLLWKLPKMAQDFDVIHVHSPNPLAELAALFISKDKPIVCTHHSDVVRQKWLLPIYGRLFHKFLSRVSKIFVPTQNHIKFSHFLPEFKDKCVELPFSISTAAFHKNTEVEKEIAELKQTYGQYALFVGRLVGYKGVDVLIEAMKEIDHQVLIVGEGPLEQSLKAKVHELKLDSKIHFLGRVQDRALFSALYHACHFVVLPSVSSNENFGVVQLEAMYCEKAVITTDLESGVPVVGQKGETCLIVPPSNSGRLAMAMSMLFQNPELSESMGRKGKLRFLEKFTSELMIEGHVHEYELTSEVSKARSRALKDAA